MLARLVSISVLSLMTTTAFAALTYQSPFAQNSPPPISEQEAQLKINKAKLLITETLKSRSCDFDKISFQVGEMVNVKNSLPISDSSGREVMSQVINDLMTLRTKCHIDQLK